jgi:peroxiredoxin
MKLSPGNYRLVPVTVIALILAAAGISPVKAQEKPLSKNPTFKLLDLDGRMTDLGELRGSVVLISFGATWCAPCTTELRALEEVLKEYSEKPVKFFWVSIEAPEEVTDAALRRYAKQRKVSFPVLRDASQAVFMQFTNRVRLPLIVMLARDGHVDQPVQFGVRSPTEAYKSDIRARLNKLLAVSSESDR